MLSVIESLCYCFAYLVLSYQVKLTPEKFTQKVNAFDCDVIKDLRQRCDTLSRLFSLVYY